MNKKYVLRILFLFSFSLLSVPTSQAQTVEIFNASKDNTLYENGSGSLSNGAGIHFFVGRTNQSSNSIRRALIAFDLSSIPTDATVDSVSLELTMNRTTAGSQSVELHRVTADWGEGSSDAGDTRDGDGTTAAPDDATWIHTFFNSSTWTNPGGDFSATVSATQSVSANSSYTWGSTAELIADVQAWVNNSAENFGWILIGNEGEAKTSKRFASKENSAGAPVLTVRFFSPASVENKPNGIPTKFSLSQNYPNPFNPSTLINYTIPQSINSTRVKLEIFSLLGQKVRTLVNKRQNPGHYQIEWDGRNDVKEPVASGIYLYRLKAGSLSEAHRMVLLR